MRCNGKNLRRAMQRRLVLTWGEAISSRVNSARFDAHGGFADDDGSGGISGGFKEDDHPRDQGGKFTDKSGGGDEPKGAVAGGDGGSGTDEQPQDEQKGKKPVNAPPVDQKGWTVAQKEAYATKGTLQRPGFHAPTDEEKKALKIAPGYVDVWANDDTSAGLQWTAWGKTGLQKSEYSLDHKQRQKSLKFQRNIQFDAAVPALRSQITTDINEGGKDRGKASVVRIVLLTGMRIGGEEASTFGATTLQKQHVTFTDDGEAHIKFWGKGGFENVYFIDHPETVQDLRGRVDTADTPESRLFDVRAASTLAYVKKAAGGPYKNHDMRTWVATDTARSSFSSGEPPATEQEFWERREAALRLSATQINDTLNIAERDYVNPAIFDEARSRLGIAADAERPKSITRPKEPKRPQMPGYVEAQKDKQRVEDEEEE